jgi:uncharacterized MAPEG superfamily protein
MSRELFWLTLTIAMTGLMWVPYIIDRIRVRGMMGSFDDPFRGKPQSAWAQRMMHAHANAIENLVLFGLLVMISDSLLINTPMTAFACALYFWSRLAHFVVYAAGIPYARTLTFTGGFIAQVILVVQIFRLGTAAAT